MPSGLSEAYCSNIKRGNFVLKRSRISAKKMAYSFRFAFIQQRYAFSADPTIVPNAKTIKKWPHTVFRGFCGHSGVAECEPGSFFPTELSEEAVGKGGGNGFDVDIYL